MKIEITKDSVIKLYTVSVDGNVILECLSAKEVDELTIAEIRRLADER